MRPRGAYVMGRNMFGPIRGEWDEDWRGWWGPEPPYHAPVFVLTHHAREPIEMEGGTTFHFVTDGFDAAYAQAREIAGEDGVDIAGGASTVRQALIAGVIDELTLDIAPVLLGSGERLFDGVESFGFEPVEVLHSPLATHIRYRRRERLKEVLWTKSPERVAQERRPAGWPPVRLAQETRLEIVRASRAFIRGNVDAATRT